VLIDLGEDWDRPAEPESPQWTRGLRPLAVLGALLPALVLTSAAPAPAPLLTMRANLELGPSEELIEFSPHEIIVRDGRVVTVYERDGRKRWHATLSSVNDVHIRVDGDHGRVLAMVHRMQLPRTVALDLTTGKRVWEFDGWAEMIDDLVVVNSSEGEDLAVYQAGSLDELWSASGLAAHTVDSDTRTVLALHKDGTITEYALATGTVLRTGHLDLPPAVHYGVGFWGGVLAVFYASATDHASTMLAFDRSTFAPLPGVEPRFSDPVRFECGDVVCETGHDGGQINVVDPATGGILWQARYGASLMATPAGLFAFAQFESSNTPLSELLEPRTGRRLASLAGWQPIPVDGRHRAAPVVLRHTTGTQGRTFIGGFDRGGLRVLGQVPHIIFHCQYADWALACVTGDRRLLVIEINSEHWQA
jgi:outer membrane protein assembly factor BamB